MPREILRPCIRHIINVTGEANGLHMEEYIKIIVGVASGLFFTYLFSRTLEYIVNRYFSSIDERFESNTIEHKEFYNRIGEAEKKIGIIETRCDEREK